MFYHITIHMLQNYSYNMLLETLQRPKSWMRVAFTKMIDRFYLLHGLLNGLPDLSFEDNIEVFRNVHAFISKTKRFQSSISSFINISTSTCNCTYMRIFVCMLGDCVLCFCVVRLFVSVSFLCFLCVFFLFSVNMHFCKYAQRRSPSGYAVSNPH